MAISKVKVSSKIEKSFRVDVGCSNPFVVDQPKEGGGNNEGPNPLEVFLAGLSSCLCTVGKIVAMQQRIKVRSIEAEVEGDIDKDFLMGATTEGRAGFTEIRTVVKIDADITNEEKEAFLAEIERRCPIADNIANITKMTAEIVE